jgi:hypothetical protein
VAHLDYTPALDGLPVDPSTLGGSVDTLKLYATATHTEPPTASVGAAVRVSAGLYRFTISDSLTGRFYPRVGWTPSVDDDPVTDDLPYVDLPVRADLVLSPEDLAVRLGLALPINAALRETLTSVLLDAQDDVVAYLGRPILPAVYTDRRTWPAGGAWTLSNSPVLSVLSEVEELDDAGTATGYWLVTYQAGLDVRGDPTYRPIRRVLLAHAAEHPTSVRLWSSAGDGTAGGDRRVKSVGAEGQSVSYEYVTPGGGRTDTAASADVVGGPVRWTSIDRWRLRARRVFTRRDLSRHDTFWRV